MDRLPPHSEAIERSVLGCVMLDPASGIPECVERIGESIEAFYDLRHQTIYAAIVAMYDLQFPIDLVTLQDWLQVKNELEAVGGVSYLAELSTSEPSSENLGYYLDRLMESFRSRKLIQLGTEAVSKVYDDESQTDAVIESASSKLLDLANQQVSQEMESIAEIIPRSIDAIESFHNHQGLVTGIATGLTDLDHLTTGFHGGEMIVIAGRPGMGKTSFALEIIEHAAIDLGLPVGMFSLEMTRDSLGIRMICSRARVNLRAIKDGFIAERDFPKIAGAAGQLHASKIYINDKSGLSILGLRARARRMHQQFGIKLLVVDYIQLLSADRSKNDNRQTEVSMVSAGIKSLAKDLNIPVIALSQLSRGIEKDGQRRPRLSDLRESGSIEQDADFVGILCRSKLSEGDEYGHEDDAIPVDLEVCKQRNGPTGTIPFTFLRCYTRFESCSKVMPEESPYNPPYPSDSEPVDSPQTDSVTEHVEQPALI